MSVRRAPPRFRRWLALCLCLSVAAPGASAQTSRDAPVWAPDGLLPGPDAWVVDATRAPAARVVSVPTGRVSRVSGTERPRSSRRVQGRVHTITWAWPRGTGSRVVFETLRAQLDGAVWFECAGRDCGDAEYFAHEVFDVPDLYGRDAQQFYVAQGRGAGARLIYVAERGTREVFAHVVEIMSETGTPGVGRVGPTVTLAGPARTSPDEIAGGALDARLQPLADALRQTTDPFDRAVVVHARGTADTDGLARSRVLARAVMMRLEQLGGPALSAHGVGHLVPAVLGRDDVRIEIVVTDPAFVEGASIPGASDGPS